MLINHRHSAYVDAEELERAAGLLSIEAEKYGYDEPHYHQLQGASAAIRALCEQKTITAAEDFMVVFELKTTGVHTSRKDY